MAEPIWNQWLGTAQDYGQRIKDAVGYIPKRMGEASDIAEQRFPDQDRDSSSKNAFRHALGTGMLAQDLASWLGGSIPARHIGAAAAKVGGYMWEAPSWSGARNAKVVMDSMHDLNANAIGARESINAQNQAELVRALEAMAKGAVREFPPGPFSSSPGYLTRTGR